MKFFYYTRFYLCINDTWGVQLCDDGPQVRFFRLFRYTTDIFIIYRSYLWIEDMQEVRLGDDGQNGPK